MEGIGRGDRPPLTCHTSCQHMYCALQLSCKVAQLTQCLYTYKRCHKSGPCAAKAPHHVCAYALGSYIYTTSQRNTLPHVHPSLAVIGTASRHL